MPDPTVSILIPNYNNGRESSHDGSHDFIECLLLSLQRTLETDPTPFEILVCDDGTTDDSLDTLRQWAGRSWPDGRPFLELIEHEHCGILSRIANVLSHRARGRILARLDGDVECLTDHWVTKLTEVFDTAGDSVGVVGPKQLGTDGRIHAFGDWLLHPKGYTHIAKGQDRHSVQMPLEVDHVMGCFYCCRKSVWEQLEGYDETFLRGQTVDFGMRSRLAGHRCLAVPHIEFIHAHRLRNARPTTADTLPGVRQSLARFEQKWGFSRIAPDLDVVRHRYGGTPLLWHPHWLGPPPPSQPVPWPTYQSDPAIKSRIDLRANVARQILQLTETPRRTAIIGCGEGLVVEYVAQQGCACVGIDRSKEAIDLATRSSATRSYDGPRPHFAYQSEPSRLPLEDAEVDLAFICDEMERHPNPVALIRESARVLEAQKPLVVISSPKPPREASPTEPEHRYLWEELIGQFSAVGGFELAMDPNQAADQPVMILVLRKVAAKASAA